MICECCGKKLADEVKYLSEIGLSVVERGIMSVMIESTPNPVTLETLLSRVYDTPRTVTRNASIAIRVTITRMRKKLAPHGWTINSDGGKGGRGHIARYTLEKVK